MKTISFKVPDEVHGAIQHVAANSNESQSSSDWVHRIVLGKLRQRKLPTRVRAGMASPLVANRFGCQTGPCVFSGGSKT